MKPPTKKRAESFRWKNVGIIGLSIGGNDSEMIRGIIQYKTERARFWNMILGAHNREDVPRLLENFRIDGIITHVTDLPYGALLKKHRIMTVDVAGMFPQFQFPVVTLDTIAAAELAAREFLNLGYQNFWAVDLRNPSTTEPSPRYVAFHDLLAAQGYRCRRIFVGDVWQWQNAVTQSKPWPPLLRDFVDSIKSGLPAAVFAASDRIGVAFVNLMQMMNIAIPEQVSMIAVGDVEVICEFCTPSLTSIRMPMRVAGYEAARRLDLMMEGKELPSGPFLFRPDHITVRQSTNPMAVSDSLVARALRVLDQHHAEPFTVKELAHHLNATVRSVQRHFEATLKHSPKQELTRIRVAHAKNQILSTNKQLKEIAYDTGFPSQSTFERAFRQIAGLSASAFQEKYGTTPR